LTTGPGFTAAANPDFERGYGTPSIAGPVSWRPPIGIHGPNELPLRFGDRTLIAADQDEWRPESE
jgi:hypothetical protein